MLARTKKPRTETVKVGKDVFHIPKASLSEVSEVVRRYSVEGSVSSKQIAAFQKVEKKYGPFGAILRGLRAREDMTQTELARALGLKQPNIADIERGERPIGKDLAKKIAVLFHTDYRIFL